VSTALATEAAHIQEVGHLSATDIAWATKADESTVRAWIRGARSPKGARADRLLELSAVVERAVGVMEADYVPVWVRKPVGLLEDRKPLDLVRAGSYRAVLKAISNLEGMPVS
jgi:uncharacterized protein (DUF2384 family)